MKRIYQRKPRKGEWETIRLKDLPRGLGGAVGPDHVGGMFGRIADQLRNMLPGEVIYTIRYAYRVIEK